MTLMRSRRNTIRSRGPLALSLRHARNRVLKHLERLPRELPLEETNDDAVTRGIAVNGLRRRLGRTTGTSERVRAPY